MSDDYSSNDNGGNSGNDSNQPSNSNDNYQQMPDPEPPTAIVISIPDLGPPPDFRLGPTPPPRDELPPSDGGLPYMPIGGPPYEGPLPRDPDLGRPSPPDDGYGPPGDPYLPDQPDELPTGPPVDEPGPYMPIGRPPYDGAPGGGARPRPDAAFDADPQRQALWEVYGPPRRPAAEPPIATQPTEFDWQGRRLGRRRIWDPRTGRYV